VFDAASYKPHLVVANDVTSSDKHDQHLEYKTIKDDTMISDSFLGLLENCYQDVNANCTFILWFICYLSFLRISELSYSAGYLYSKTLDYVLPTSLSLCDGITSTSKSFDHWYLKSVFSFDQTRPLFLHLIPMSMIQMKIYVTMFKIFESC
jgi:hypothetical protein